MTVRGLLRAAGIVSILLVPVVGGLSGWLLTVRYMEHQTLDDSLKLLLTAIWLGGVFGIALLAILATIEQRRALRFWGYSRVSAWTSRGFCCACSAWLCFSLSFQPWIGTVEIKVAALFCGLVLETFHWLFLLWGFHLLFTESRELAEEFD